jgi:hypothetical protein
VGGIAGILGVSAKRVLRTCLVGLLPRCLRDAKADVREQSAMALFYAKSRYQLS